MGLQCNIYFVVFVPDLSGLVALSGSVLLYTCTFCSMQ